MSFNMTIPQFQSRTKTVTRRLGWRFAKPGDVYMGVEKAQGLRAGESVVRLGLIRVVNVWREPLNYIDAGEVVREGFHRMPPHEFIQMFSEANKCPAHQEVARIEFEYLPCAQCGSPVSMVVNGSVTLCKRCDAHSNP